VGGSDSTTISIDCNTIYKSADEERMKEPGMNPALVRGATSRHLGDPGAIGVSCVSAMPDIRKLSCPCGAGAAHLISYLYRGAARTCNIDLILLVDLVASTTGLPMETPG